MSDIIISGLCKSFGDNEVLRDVDLRFAEGSITLIMGESGCGKSTLIKLIMGLLTPDGGSISGTPHRISAVFQEDRLCDDFSALTNVRVTAARGSTAEQLLCDFAALGLLGNEKKPVRELSGGMKRRVALLRALFADSELLILDEPFTGLDDDNRAAAAELILKRRRGRTVIVVTHEAEDAALLGAQTVYINK